jgi:cobalt-zinc-cadmium efflux system outer membrane protein
MKWQSWAVSIAAALVALHARAEERTLPITFGETLARAAQASPLLAVARGKESVAAAEVDVAGVYPNPTVMGGTSTQAAKLSVGGSVPLVIFGQRGAAMAASRADLGVVQVETQATGSDVRAGAGKAFVSLWLAERTARARAEADRVAALIEQAVTARVEVGAAPELEGVRVRAQRLRASADAIEADQLVGAASAELGRWIGAPGVLDLRTSGDPVVPERVPRLAELASRIGANPLVRREQAEARAAEARADRERALVRPALAVEVGADIQDPTLPATNYRGQLSFELPLFNQRGPFIEREERAARAARARSDYERAGAISDLAAAYRTFEAVSARSQALAAGVVPAAESAARATRESYQLGRASLEALLDAERARIDAELSLLETNAARANAWIDIERTLGVP